MSDPAPEPDPRLEASLGARLRRYREERGLSLGQLGEKADISKGYLSTLENTADARPSAETLFSIAEALGVTIADLMGRKPQVAGQREISASLRAFADEAELPEADVAMLAAIQFRGEQPQTKERWRYIYNAIRTSTNL